MLQNFAQDIVQFIDKQGPELEIEHLILAFPRKFLFLPGHLSIVIIDQLLPPVHHKDRLEESVSSSRNSRRVRPDEGTRAEVDQVGQLPRI